MGFVFPFVGCAYKVYPNQDGRTIPLFDIFRFFFSVKVSIRYLVAVKFDEQDVVYDTAEPEPEQ